MSTGWIIALIVGGIFLIWVGVKVVRVVVPIVLSIQEQVQRVQDDRPREALVETVTSPEKEFTLTHVVNTSSQLNLFLHYSLNATRIGSSNGRPISDAGLVVRFTAVVDGQELGSFVVGKGQQLPCEVDTVCGTTYDKRLFCTGASYGEEATIPLVSFKPRPPGTEIVVSGQVLLNTNTSVSSLRLFLS